VQDGSPNAHRRPDIRIHKRDGLQAVATTCLAVPGFTPVSGSINNLLLQSPKTTHSCSDFGIAEEDRSEHTAEFEVSPPSMVL
jgi:hypothetical protein